VEVTGSIYSITSDNSNYAQVPWLEKSEIFSRMPMKPCVVCNVQEENTKKINWKGQDYYFCSYNHYLDWRQNEINVHGARDVVTPPSVASYFTELQIISENTSAAQREKAQKRVLRMKVWNYMKSSIGWIIFVKIGVLIYHSLFG
jgi:YHS domain-containing protein